MAALTEWSDDDGPEFLLMFSGRGTFTVEARLLGCAGWVSSRKATAAEVKALLAQPWEGQRMYFDEHPFEVVRCEMDSSRRTLTIVAKRPGWEGAEDDTC